MESVYEYRALLACDIASSSGRGEAALQEIRAALEQACHAAFRAAGLDWERCRRQDTGDGFQLVAPPGVQKRKLLHPALPGLATLLRAHNGRAPEHLRIRLRVALHAGEVRLDPDGGACGAPFEILARLLNAAPLRTALADAPDSVPIAAILSQHYGEETVGHFGVGPAADAFVPVGVLEKAYRGQAWIHYPGSPIGPRVATAWPLAPGQLPPKESQTPDIARVPAGSSVQKNRASGHGKVFAVQNGALHLGGEGAA
jgi:hypothetical protein